MPNSATPQGSSSADETRTVDPAGAKSAAAQVGPGARLGDFVLEEKMAEGGFGSVFLARQQTLNRQVVVKVLLSQRSDADSVQRFIQEARLVAQLDHPYVAQVHAFGAEPDGVMWLAMERVRGITLSEYLDVHGRMALDGFLSLFEHVCDVVGAAHDRGIVHRDLKPSNIMVLSQGGRLVPKLLDFGIAKQREHVEPHGGETPALAQTGTQTINVDERKVVGSPPFMAPEQWEPNAQVDARTDIYALACVAFRMLTGRYPFIAETAPELKAAHQTTPFPKVGEGLPAALDDVLSRGAAKNPDERYASVREFQQALHQAAGRSREPAKPLAHLDEDLARRVVTEAPRPIAEAFVVFDVAPNEGTQREAFGRLVETIARYLAVLALAGRGRVAPPGGDSPRTRELVARLQREDLGPSGWVDLADQLVRGFATRRELHPLPELVSFFAPVEGESSAQRLLGPLLQGPREGGLKDATERLAALFRSLDFVFQYQLVIPRRDGRVGDRWMGARRVAQPEVQLGLVAQASSPILLDADGALRETLHPVAQAAPPSPGAAPELFLPAGPGRFGMRLQALPVGYERQDDELVQWFAREFPNAERIGAAAASGERPPYLGLASFGAGDADVFFGREKEADAFLNRLRSSSLLAVVGASGAGKSSFVLAGVLPALPKHYRPVILRPGTAPRRALCDALRRAGIELGGADVAPATVGEALRRQGRDRGTSWVLVVDQLEELVTLCADGGERAWFAEALAAAARDRSDPVRVIVTLRDDFLMRVQALPALSELLPVGLQLLSTPAPDDLLRILIEPARRMGYSFSDPQLPKVMVDQVAAEPGALALLSFTAFKLWELRDKHLKVLSRTAYDSLGGVGGALAQHAEELLTGLSVAEAALVREAFRHLVTAEGTRAVLSRAELRQLLGHPADSDRVVERLIAGRLLVGSEGKTHDEDRIEVTHEALLRAWPRLVQWQRDDAENARVRDQLRAAARQWADRGRLRPLLWRGELLLELRVWRARYPGKVTELENEFAQQSIREEQRGQRIRRGLTAGAFAALLVFLAAMGVFLVRLDRAQRETSRRIALMHEEQGRLSLLDAKPMQALTYLTQAYREGIDGAANRYMRFAAERATDGLLKRTRAHHGRILSFAASDDGRLAVTGGSDGQIKVWDLRSNSLVGSISLGERVASLSLDRNGRVLVAGTAQGRVGRYDLPAGTPMAAPPRSTARVSAAQSPTGRYLAVVTIADMKLEIFEHGDRLLHSVKLTGQMESVSFDPLERFVVLAPGPDDLFLEAAPLSVWVVELATGRIREIAIEGAPARTVTFDHSGRLVATGSQGGWIEWFEVASGKRLQRVNASPRPVRALAFSRDARWLVAGADDGRGLVVKVADGTVKGVLVGHAGPVRVVQFSPDGSQVATASEDMSVRLWSATGSPKAVLFGHTDLPLFLAWPEGGSSLTSAGYDGDVISWSPQVRMTSREIDLGGQGNEAIALAADRGTAMATFPSDHIVQLDLRDGRVLSRWPGFPAATTWCFAWSSTHQRAFVQRRPPGAIVSVPTWQEIAEVPFDCGYALASDSGHLLLVTSKDAESRYEIRNMADATLRCAGRFGARMGAAAAFSSDDRHVYAGLSTGFLELVDTQTCAQRRSWQAHQGYIRAVSLSPGDEQLLTAGSDQVVKLWRTADGAMLRSFAGHRAAVVYVAFAFDGQVVVSAGADGEVRAWDASTGDLLNRFIVGQDVASFRFVGDDGGLLSVHPSTVKVWPFQLSSASPDEASAAATARSPYALSGEQLSVRP